MDKREIRIASAGMRSKFGEKRRNLDKVMDWCKKAKSEGAELVCFPELNLSGFAAEDYEVLSKNKEKLLSFAEEVPEGEASQMLQKLAKQLDIYICAGLLEKDKDKLYNTQILAGPSNYFGKYRKTQVHIDNRQTFSAGNDIPLFTVKGCQIGIVICWENLYFPEVTRTLAVRGADILLHPGGPLRAQAPKKRRKDSDYQPIMLGLVRALENSVFVVASVSGYAYIVDPRGRIIAEEDDMAIGSCNLEIRNPQHFSLRRPETYKALTSRSGS